MPRIPIFRLGPAAEELEPPRLTGYTPAIALDDLQVGVDNLRHDVHLSQKFVDQARLHIARMIMRHGNLEGLLAAETVDRPQPNHFIGAGVARKPAQSEPADLKPLLAEILVVSLNRAKAAENISVDLLGRLAIIKFLRTEINLQFAQVLERCRMMLKTYEGVRQQKALEYRERVAGFQVAKKIIQRKAGQELYRILREIEKETLARMRRSFFGARGEAQYPLFLNPLIFTEDGRDIYLNAEHYVLFGNFDRDLDRFSNVRRVACEFLGTLNLGPDAAQESILDAWLNVPENAQELVGSGTADDSSRAQKLRLGLWTEYLESEGVLDYVIASYEVLPLLAEYAPRINAQQLKNALISREERERVEKLMEERGAQSADELHAAGSRVSGCRGSERARVAARFLHDLLRYHRDLRRLETLNSALDSVNLIGNQKMRELSAMNDTLYEFSLADEQRPTEEKVLRHVVIKADVRDSTRLTRSLLQADMNPASYFTLNFYEPVNKLLPKYGATKVFLEGDAIILAILEREGEPGLGVSRACVLAREMIEIVRGYNQLLQRAGLPTLEIGIGISYQDSAPMYLMDGDDRIMISDALNESDRLSSCHKRVRKPMERLSSPFNVYAFQTVAEPGENTDDFRMNYNLSGVRMSEAAFKRLQQEISLEPCQLKFPQLWGNEEFRLFSGLVPLGNDIFKRIVLRVSRIPHINPADFSLVRWTENFYFEVCSNPAIYAALEGKGAKA
jgi:hypothetical protein